MSDVQATAIALWSRLQAALMADGMIAAAITQTGPQTTQLILQLALDNTLQERQELWVPVAIIPAPTAELWGRNFDHPDLPGMVLRYSDRFRCWIERDTGLPARWPITHYIVLPDIGKPLVPYVKPDAKPEPEVL